MTKDTLWVYHGSAVFPLGTDHENHDYHNQIYCNTASPLAESAEDYTLVGWASLDLNLHDVSVLTRNHKSHRTAYLQIKVLGRVSH
jgi:hypothetical protein